MSVKQRRNATDEEMLYEYYSLDTLKYIIDMLSILKLRLENIVKTLSKHLSNENKKNEKHESLLFDRVDGSSMGGMNGTVLISLFLMIDNWTDAIGSSCKILKG